MMKKVLFLLLAVSMAFHVSCSAPDTAESSNTKQSFTEIHDAFETTLTSKEKDDNPIPDPPEGFDLVQYSSKTGALAAYVSSNPGDGQKHPMIIWVAGGWGNGIDDFPWTYPMWDNDQTGSAFWRAGILTMYPSFRGGCGNPGYYETLFGEVDDIVSAYEYAASLPYVDPNRIYLGGHSTGGTCALLAAEYTDQFRAVFAFGAVDKIESYDSNQFTFDTNSENEYRLRSPIYWLDQVKTPTFLIEGSGGNASCLKNIKHTSQNDNIHCYLIQSEDHFSVLAPLTRLIAQKILEDTGTEPSLSITQKELEEAMKQEPEIPLPVMQQYTIDKLGIRFSYPYLWDLKSASENGELAYSAFSRHSEENVWDMAGMYIDVYRADDEFDLQTMAGAYRDADYEVSETTINGLPAIKSIGIVKNSDGIDLKNSFVAVQKDDVMVALDFYIFAECGNDADSLFEAIANSITFE